jgi:hypothetical protein
VWQRRPSDRAIRGNDVRVSRIVARKPGVEVSSWVRLGLYVAPCTLYRQCPL